MAEQELSVADSTDDAARKHAELKEQIRSFLKQLKEQGVSQNQLETKYGLGKGKVSNAHRPGAYGPHFPNLKLINALCIEVQERCEIQPGVIDAFRLMYGETLEAICAREDPAPHNTHILMRDHFRYTEKIAAITRDTSEAHALITQLTEERETLRDDRDEERRRRIEQLTQQRSAWLVQKRTLLAERDRVSDELDKLEAGQEAALRETAPDLRASHAKQHPDELQAPVTLQAQPPAKVPVPALYKTLAAAFCVTVLGFAVYGVVQLVRGDDNTDDGAKSADTKASAPATDTPATQPSTDSTPSSSPTPTVPPKQKTTAPYPNEPLPLILTTPPCDNVAEIDFDRVPFSKWIDTSDLIDDYSPTEATDMTWSGCAPEIWETMPEAHAGIVRKGTKLTEASCRAAANGGGLEFYRMWDGNPGFEKGANLCVLTDKGRLVAAEVVDLKSGSSWAFTFDVTTVA